MSDPLEELNIKAHSIKLVCENACDKFGIPIDYKPHCSPEHADLVNASLGPANMLWRDVEMLSRSIIRNAWGGGSDPSPFKTVAAVSLAIVGSAPIPEFFTDKIVGEKRLPQIASFQFAPAAIIALDYSLSLLHTCKVGDEMRELSNPLEVSNHYYLDAIAALTFFGMEMKRLDRGDKLGPTKVPFSMLSLIYEAVAYKTNTEAENDPKIAFQRP